MVSRMLRLVVLWEALWALGIAYALHAAAGWSWTLAALAGILTPLGVHGLILAWGFVDAMRFGGPAPGAFRRSRSGVARAWWGEFGASVRAFQLQMPWMPRRALASAATPRPGAVPVLLIHGYCCNRQVWRPLAKRLGAAGHVVDAVDLEPVFGSIDRYPALIASAIEALRMRTGAARVALVGHSMGGLAARAFVRDFGAAGIDRVVTIGSPHQGTRNARRGWGENARQMAPGSAWLRALEARESHEDRRLFTVILSHHDNVIVPQSGQTLAGARTIEFGGIGHLRMIADPEVTRAVLDALRGESPSSAAGTQPDPP